MTLHRRASLFLILATTVWGMSFPLTRALAACQLANLPGVSSWFLTSLTICLRFGVSGLWILLVVLRGRLRPTRSEWTEGLGLAVFASGGILFQNDGLFYTSASVSAFLTQAYCAIIPIYTMLRLRKAPKLVEMLAVLLVLAGVVVLSGLSWHDLRLGRGEFETLISSVFFAGQILWLERPDFKENRPAVFSTVMFLGIGLMMLVFSLFTGPVVSGFSEAFQSGSSLFLVGALTLLCTLFTFSMMNHWQPHVTATEAGLIYCIEPVFAAFFALFLPDWISQWSGLALANESFTPPLILGGCLILAANLLVLFPPEKWAVRDSNPEPSD